MSQNLLTDEQIISGIRNEGSREKTLSAIFETLGWYGAATTYVVRHGGSREDAEEVADDAFIAFDRNIRHGRFNGQSSLKTYFHSIAKRLWWKRLRSRRALLPLELKEWEDTTESVEAILISEERKLCFDQALEQVSERCKHLLRFSALDATMKEIAHTMDFTSPEMAKKEVYRCRKRFQQFLEAHPAWLNRLKQFLTNDEK